MSGNISSTQGGPVVRAKISLSWSLTRGSIQSQVYREVISDAQGNFNFSGLAKGNAILSARVPGFEDYSRSRSLSGGNEHLNIDLIPR